MKTPDRIEGRVSRIFSDALGIDVPSPDTDVIERGLLDSLALVELLFAIEREFNVEIVLEQLEIESFRSIRSIAEFVGRSDSLQEV